MSRNPIRIRTLVPAYPTRCSVRCPQRKSISDETADATAGFRLHFSKHFARKKVIMLFAILKEL